MHKKMGVGRQKCITNLCAYLFLKGEELFQKDFFSFIDLHNKIASSHYATLAEINRYNDSREEF